LRTHKLWLDLAYYEGALARSFLLSLVLNFLVLLAVWRAARPALVAMVPLAFATVLAFGFMPLFGVYLNAMTIGVGAIVVGLGIDYPIHIVERFREERRNGLAARRAAERALATMGPHLLAGMLTTALGFCATLVLMLPISQSFGLLTAAGVLLVYLASLYLLPLLLARERAPR